MERFRCLPKVRVVDDSSDEVEEWIPTRQEFLQVYKDVRTSYASDRPHVDRTPFAPKVEQPEVCDIIPTSRKIGKCTFVEGCFDAVLLLACCAGNVPVVSYLLTSYIQYFSIDTLIDKLSGYGFKRALRGSRGMARFEQLNYDKVSLLHAAAEGLRVDVIKLLLSAGAKVNNPTKWLLSPLSSALIPSKWSRELSCQRTVVCLIDSGANVNCRDADGMTPLMYAASRFRDGVDLVLMLVKAGANPYAMDSEGFTALHHACMGKSSDIVKYLLKIAPDLLLLRGKPSLACIAPYLSIFEAQVFNLRYKVKFMQQTKEHISVFLDFPTCPSSVKFDIHMLRVVCQVMLAYERPSLDIPSTLKVLKKFIASDIDPVVPVSFPRDIAKEKYQLALLKSIKSMEPTSRSWHQKTIQQCWLVLLSCYTHSSIPMMSMLYEHSCCVLNRSHFGDYSNFFFVEQLAKMICFRLDTIQYVYLSQGSLTKVLMMSEHFIDFACRENDYARLELAIHVFSALATSLEKVSIRCVHLANKVLNSCGGMIFEGLLCHNCEKETAILMSKFAKCNPPLLVNTNEGYAESLLHILLSRHDTLTSPLLQTFLHSGGDKWINTPGVNGLRPLHLHISREFTDLLIDYGAHFDAVDADGSTPKYCNEYLKSNPRPLSCIIARSILKTGGLTEYEINILPRRVQAFISLHDGHATRAEVDSVLLYKCTTSSM